MTTRSKPSPAPTHDRLSVALPKTGGDGRTSSDLDVGKPLSALLCLTYAVIGIGISAYLTVVHYAKVPLACPRNGVINCQAVTTSPYSVIGHTSIPITLPGMGWFIVSGLFAAVAVIAWLRGSSPPSWLTPGHLVWATAGVIFVLYLVYVEAVRLHEFCEWCSGVHVLVILTFLTVLARWQRTMA